MVAEIANPLLGTTGTREGLGEPKRRSAELARKKYGHNFSSPRNSSGQAPVCTPSCVRCYKKKKSNVVARAACTGMIRCT